MLLMCIWIAWMLFQRFLAAVGTDERNAFLKFNLAPLRLRREIAILGVLHKRAHGTAHPDMCGLFGHVKVLSPRDTRRVTAPRLHGLQFRDFCREATGHAHAMLKRSAFGMIRIWKPPDTVKVCCSSAFQAVLKNRARTAAEAEADLERRGLYCSNTWRMLYHPGVIG